MTIAATEIQNRAAILLQELIRRADAGETLAWLKAFVEQLGFAAEILTFEGTPNLWATRKGTEGRAVLGFLGHVDVVPAGEGWVYPPFGGVLEEGTVWGRGATDMKGGIACFLAAVERVVAQEEAQGEKLPGLELLISGDEEGLAVGGTPAVLRALAARARPPRWRFVLVGEPTSHTRLGDLIKVGCRGSLNVRVEVSGQGGHVAYPAFSANPVPPLMTFLERAKTLVEGRDRGALKEEARAHPAAGGAFVPACDKRGGSPAPAHETLAGVARKRTEEAPELPAKERNSAASLLQKVPFAEPVSRAQEAREAEAVFEPSHMEVTAFRAGGEATNVVPAQAVAHFNIRFSPPTTAEALIVALENLAQAEVALGVTFALTYDKAGSPVLSIPSLAHEALAEAVREVTGEAPERSAKGANSDARFLQGVAFAELGLRVQEAHQPNEKARLEDLERLTQIYQAFLTRLGSVE